jgi:pimeloyl-ACP methyl ester carboxylesterase
MPSARVNGIEIAYETYGDGVPLVLAHGYMAAKEMWDAQIGPFMERYRVVVYDVRGHGASEAPPVDDAGYTIETLVEDQRALMAHLGIEQAFVGGLSLGGMIAVRFALAHPSMVRALLLCDTSPGMATQGQWAANRSLMEGVVRSQGVGAMVRAFYTQRSATIGIPRQDTVPSGILGFVQRLDGMSPDGFLGVARAAGESESVLDRLGEIAAPTLVLTGEGDFFRGASEEMAERIPGARFVLIKDAFHGTCLWQPEKFTSAVLDFLADVEAGRPVTGREER